MGNLDEMLVAEKQREAALAWPFVVVEEARFRAAMERAMGEEGATLEGIHAADLYLALACLAGQTEAIAAFERHVMSEIRPSVKRAAAGGEHDVEDAMQSAREKLFVGGNSGGPRLAQYTGRGPLVGWVRVVAVREVLQAQRKTRRIAQNDDTALVAGGSNLASIELGMLRDLHSDAFREAVQQALRSLTVEQRTILRFHTKDGLTIDQLAPMLGIHRATAARRLERARADALDATRTILRQRHGLSESEARSLCLALANEVDVSIGRALGDEATR